MFRIAANVIREFRIGRWCCLAVVIGCVSFSGCACLDVSDDGFDQDQITTWGESSRRSDTPDHGFFFSNEAHQINRNFKGR